MTIDRINRLRAHFKLTPMPSCRDAGGGPCNLHSVINVLDKAAGLDTKYRATGLHGHERVYVGERLTALEHKILAKPTKIETKTFIRLDTWRPSCWTGHGYWNTVEMARHAAKIRYKDTEPEYQRKQRIVRVTEIVEIIEEIDP